MVILEQLLDREAETDQKRRLYFFSPIFFKWNSTVFSLGLLWNLEA